MKHPQREEWVPYVFGEADAETKRRLGEHLDECPDCAREVTAWRKSLRSLNRWTLPPAAETVAVHFPLAFKWALAAALLLGFGLLIGRLSAPRSPDLAQLQRQIESSLRTSFAAQLDSALRQAATNTASALEASEARMVRANASEQQLLWRQFGQVLEAARQEDGRAVQAALRQYEEKHGAEFVSLRKDLETLASATDEEIRQARFNLVQLAASRVPTGNP